jgi:cyclohexyl-isocyanide hydratase
MEYEPQPPFRCGSAATAPAEIVAAVRRDSDRFQAERRASCERAALRLAKSA